MFCHVCGCETGISDNYCSQCGASLLLQRESSLRPDSTFDDIIKFYFGKGYQCQFIVEQLRNFHDINLSIRTLKRHLKRLGLRRRTEMTADLLHAAENAVVSELHGPGRQMGYRLMTRTLHMKYGLRVSRQCTMEMLRRKDPTGILLRQRRVLRRRTYTALGPNYLWHGDGHDKLKRYGFAIHACIDGYSRRVVWVECSSTNNNPSVVAYYYLTAVKQLGFCCRTLRTDCGSENVTMANIQCEIRNSLRAHVYGTSQNNQRIESWWSYLRRMRTQWWIEYFNDMEESGVLNVDDSGHIDCLRFCFMDVIRRDLQEVKQLWNSHRIRKSHGARCPGGIPDHLFFTPGQQALQCAVSVSEAECAQYMERCTIPPRCQNEDFERTLECQYGMSSLGRITSIDDAFKVFVYLKSMLL